MTPAQYQRDATFARQMQKYQRALMAHQARPEGQSLAEGFNPASIGARRAPDGHHYLDDPTRPGKYLKVLWR
jgi:hypothetical protein